MFKILYNNKLEVLIIALIISFFSCDGRDRKHKTNTQVLTENDLLDSFEEQIKFIPNKPVVIRTDTILSNGFNVKIDYRSIEKNQFYEVSKKENDSIIKMNYKNFEANIIVYKDDIQISETTISKMLFREFENSSFWNSAIMLYVWVDVNASTNNMLHLNTSFNIPNTDSYKDFVVVIDEKGTIRIKEKELIC